MSIKKEYQEKMLRVLTALFPDAKIYLFGSRARGTHNEFSDVDLAIDAGHKMEFRATGEAKDVMEALYIPYKVDVVDFHRVSEELGKTILSEGIQWK